MEIKIDQKSFFIFDLDDTLFQEIDFLKSAYQNISQKLSRQNASVLYDEMMTRYYNKENVFVWLIDQNRKFPGLTVETLLKDYRDHVPAIELSNGASGFLKNLLRQNVPMGMITDGRSITQRNKIKALGIEDYFKDIIISEEFGSEKPAERNYLYFVNKYPGMEFYFFGDNTSKDFIVPGKLGWRTICVKNAGSHIHFQSFDKHPPDHIISSFHEIVLTSAFET